jgi:aquaporin Z
MKFKVILAELLGTFFFFSVILSAIDNSYGPIAIAVGLLAAIYLCGNISGGHFNPGVSIMMFFKGNLSFIAMITYITAQIIGALLALLINFYLN